MQNASFKVNFESNLKRVTAVYTESRTEDVLELLGERRVREILEATSREPMSAKALSEECEVARSTIYRRVEEMLEHGLLIERTRVRPDGSHHSVYEANVTHLGVDVENGRLDVRVQVHEGAAGRFSRMWSDIREV